MHVQIILTAPVTLMNQFLDCFEVLCQRRNETPLSRCSNSDAAEPGKAQAAAAAAAALALLRSQAAAYIRSVPLPKDGSVQL